MGKPDIILLMVDQWSAKWLEAAVAGAAPLPHLQRLQSLGTTFCQAITSNPVCSPARATLATGLTSRGHGVLENGYVLDAQVPTFMQALQKAGWRTGALGKVHLLPHFAGVFPDYRPYGFDVCHITEDARGGEWLEWVQREHPEHAEAVYATMWAGAIPELQAHGQSRQNLLPLREAARAKYKLDYCYDLPFPAAVSQTEWITAHGLDFIASTPADQPLFAHISYVQPHSPFSPPAGYRDRVDAAAIPAALPPTWESDPLAPAHWHDAGEQRPVDWAETRTFYFADLVHLDEQIGRLLDALEQRGRPEESYILFVSDHGELLGDHGFHGKSEKHYDACIRVPLILAGPGILPGVVRHELVQLEDLCPTILEMAGAALPPMPTMGPYLQAPADGIPQLPGRSLLPLCRGETPEDWRKAAYCESYNTIFSNAYSQWARTIRTADYRYTWSAGGSSEQLFDLRNDPDELHNLAAAADYSEVRCALRDQLLELIIRQDYPKPRHSLFALGVH